MAKHAHPKAPLSPADQAASDEPAIAAHTLLTEALGGLTPAEVGKIPSYARKRIERLEGLCKTAQSHAALLVKVPLEGGALKPWELAVFAVALREASTRAAEVGADVLASDPLADADAALLKQCRTDQKLIISAFRRLRFKGRSAELKRLRAIDEGDPEDVVDARNDSTDLIALADHEEHRGWIAALPLGEGDALARLKAAHPSLQRLADAGQNASAASRREQLRRLWTVLSRIETRVRAAGNYLFHDKPEAKDFRAFKVPGRRKAKAKTKTP